MPKGLRRFHHTGDWHFITSSCSRRKSSWTRRSGVICFWTSLSEFARKYDFVVAGYVVMPERFHLLIGEPRVKKLSVAMQVLKQRVSLRCRGKKRKKANQIRLWQERAAADLLAATIYDFNVFTQRKYIEKLPLHSSQSSKAWSRRLARALEMERLSGLCSG